MTKQLRVIQPVFGIADTGDMFEWNDEKSMYVFERSEEFHKSDDSDSELSSSFTSNLAISADYAKDLIAEGCLEEVGQKKTFLNVFDEIDRLNNKYVNELKTVNEDMADMPECVKVERITVLNNLIAVLDHLKNLKK